MKKCSKCGVEKQATNEFFLKQKAGKHGLRAHCKSCEALYYQENKERIAEHRKQHHQDNKERIAERKKNYHQENKEFFVEYRKQYRKNNKEHIKEQKKQHYQKNKEYIIERTKQYSKKNKEYISERGEQYRQNNKEYISEYTKQYYQNNKEYIAEHLKQYYQNNKEHIAERYKQYCQENPEKIAIKSQRRRAKKKELDSTLTFEQWEKIKKDFNNKCAYCGKEKKLEQEHFLPISKGGEYTHNNIIPACRNCNSGKGNKMFHEWYPKYKHYSKKREKQLLQYLGYNNNIQQLSIF